MKLGNELMMEDVVSDMEASLHGVNSENSETSIFVEEGNGKITSGRRKNLGSELGNMGVFSLYATLRGAHQNSKKETMNCMARNVPLENGRYP